MTDLINLNSWAITAVLLLFLLLQLAGLFTVITAWSTARKRAIYHGAFLLTLICFLILTFLTAALYEKDNGRQLSSLTAFFARQPAISYLLLFAGAGLYLATIIKRQRTFRRNVVTRTAIKESADNLPAGLCFGAKSGLVILSNRTMERLSHALTGRDLQDATAFWETVTRGQLKAGAKRLPDTKDPIIRLNNGSTWLFARRYIEVDGQQIAQITATDTTDLEKLRLNLTEGNAQLAQMNARLRRFSKNITEVTAKEERLATKMRLHNELGHTLLSTRHILAGNFDRKKALAILDLWKLNVAVLRTGAEAKSLTMLEHLKDAAADVGISLEIKGEWPKDDHGAQLLLITAGSEALNNAVRHAAATTLTLDIKDNSNYYIACYTNDGKVPTGEIIEGGGLSALRARIERQGGSLTLESQPVFQMAITLPKQKEKSR